MLREPGGFARFNNGTELIHRYLAQTQALALALELSLSHARAIITYRRTFADAQTEFIIGRRSPSLRGVCDWRVWFDFQCFLRR